MATVQSSSDLQNTPPTGLAVVLTRFLKDLLVQVNGTLEFHSNIKSSSLLTATFNSANTNLVLSHDLGRIPVGYIVAGLSANMVVYSGTNPWTTANISLRSSAVGSAKIYVI